MTYLTYNVREYFELIKSLNNSRILDFGCNHANFLLNDFDGEYIGLDIDKVLVDKNKIKYPQHQWIHYDNYNYQYNCKLDTTDEWPNIPKSLDTIIAFSVFTHTDYSEFEYTIGKLRNCLNSSGTILATFLSTTEKENIIKVLKHRTEFFEGKEEEIADKIYNKKIVYLFVNIASKQIFILENLLELPKFSNETYLLTFYNDDWIAKKLGGEVVDVRKHFTNIMSTQKCLKLSTLR